LKEKVLNTTEAVDIPEAYRGNAVHPKTGAVLPARFLGGSKFSVPAVGERREEVWIILKRTTLGMIVEVRGPIRNDPSKAPRAHFFVSDLNQYLCEDTKRVDSIYAVAYQCSMTAPDLVRLIRHVAYEHRLTTSV
jgi:hypothetical protein